MIYSSVSTGAAIKTKTETTLTWEAKGNFCSFSVKLAQNGVQIGSCAFMLSMSIISRSPSRYQQKFFRVSPPGNLPVPKVLRENGFSLPGRAECKSRVHHHARLLWRRQVEVLSANSSGSFNFNETTKEKNPQATSQYWDTFARMAFPCLDEPHLKAQFVITLAIKGDGRWKYSHFFQRFIDTSTYLTNSYEITII